MAFESGALDATLAAAAGDDPVLLAELRALGLASLRRYPGLRGKAMVGWALLRGLLSSLPLLPKMFAKRRTVLRRRNARQIVEMLQRYRITLKALIGESA